MEDEANEAIESGQSNESQRRTRWKVDTSLVFAVLALVISSIGTLTGIYEARIMRQQQAIMQDQKAASVWPYVERGNYLDYDEENNVLEISHFLENKGIGPAVLADVDYRFDGKSIGLHEVDNEISKILPLTRIEMAQNFSVDNLVLSAGERVRVFRILITPEESIYEINFDINKIVDAYQSWFCYCSVFGSCWSLGEKDLPVPTEVCERTIE